MPTEEDVHPLKDSPADSAEEAPRRNVRKARRWTLALAAGAVVLSLAGAGASLLIKSPQQVAAEAAPPAPSVLTAEVEHRVLTSSVVVRGKVTAGQTVQVAPQVSGEEGAGSGPVLTKVAVKAGERLNAGRQLMEVSGRPVFVLPGRIPVYRDLKPGAHGEDVAQLQRALGAVGHPVSGDTQGTFGARTKAALAAFYADLGYDPLPADPQDAETLKSARRAVTDGERALQDARDTRDALPEDTSAADRRTADKAVDRAGDDLAVLRQDLAAAQAASGPKLPAAEVVYVRSFPARVDAVRGRPGEPVDGSVMTISAGALVVESYLQEFQKGLVRKGQRVEIHSETTGVTAHGRVGSVADTPTLPDDGGTGGDQGSDSQNQSSGQSGGAIGYRVLIEPDPGKPLDPRLVAQDVRLRIQSASTDGKALVVPVTALTAGADGRTTVTVRTKKGTERRVRVEPGTSGDGYVAVTPVDGGKLEAGERVVTGVGAAEDGRE